MVTISRAGDLPYKVVVLLEDVVDLHPLGGIGLGLIAPAMPGVLSARLARDGPEVNQRHGPTGEGIVLVDLASHFPDVCVLGRFGFR
ncbi:hypothetical protein [Streptomyces sp. NPDC046860]|uniref:hypothetical protein n=1 Tax=Streptomyces sp. NPDC046860 TaxID=3154495 RepID=UPI0033ED31F5